MTMTDEQIDGLSGGKLRFAVAVAVGFTVEGEGLFRSPDGFVKWDVDIAHYERDDGLAFWLLKGMKDWCIEPDCETDGLIVREQQRDMSWRELASGPLDQSAALMCRAFLKLKARETR